MEIRTLTEAERKYTYTQSMQIMGQTGCIGHLRGDFDRDGNGFFTSWDDHRKDLKTDEFKAELDDVINALRSEECGLLANRSSMRHFVAQNPGSDMVGNYCTEYGFRAETDKYAFLLRCNPIQGDYNFYCYCYVKDWLDSHIKSAEKGIRFINSHYEEQFRIADGEKIVITETTGEKTERTCRYIDEYHTEIGNSLYHICEFAECMARKGASYAPKEERQEQQKTQESTKRLIYHSEYGGDSEIQLEIQQYANNGRLAISMTTNEDGFPEPYGSLTVNIDAAAPDYCAYLDINNLSNAEKFVTENGLGEFTGITARSGYCEFPLYMFNVNKLRELCPGQMDAYEKSIGAGSKKPEKAKCR
jgi:hypothetical protein